MKKMLIVLALLCSPFLIAMPGNEEARQRLQASIQENMERVIEDSKLGDIVARIIADNFNFLIDTGTISDKELDKRIAQVWNACKKEFFNELNRVVKSGFICKNLVPSEYALIFNSSQVREFDEQVQNAALKDHKVYEKNFKSSVKLLNKAYRIYKKRK